MTNKEAIDLLLKSQIFLARHCGKTDMYNAVELAIKALEERPIDDLSEYSDKLWKQAYERGKAEARPQGEWLEVKEEVHYDYWTVCECSLCKHSWALGELSIEDIKDDYKFCPNCGADMRGGRE